MLIYFYEIRTDTNLRKNYNVTIRMFVKTSYFVNFLCGNSPEQLKILSAKTAAPKSKATATPTTALIAYGANMWMLTPATEPMPAEG